MSLAPPSWKTKCTIRRVDDLGRMEEVAPISDGGTLVMRRDQLPPMRPLLRVQYPSVPPFAIDLEDLEPPARNSDVLGMRSTMATDDYGRSVTSGSFMAGLLAGLMTLACGGGLAYASLTDAFGGQARAVPVQPRTVESIRHSLIVDHPEAVPAKIAPAPKRSHPRRAAASVAADDTAGAAPTSELEVPATPEL